MINFKKHILENGLVLITHQDKSTPFAAVNILYNVGAKHENPKKTGFAHLFEHLMFGGSENIPSFDTPIQKVGGQNNAYTTNDLTNYYITLPANNIETAFWLESDRMNKLDFSEKSLSVQRNVVCEEFRQRYINQPYGDVYSLIRKLVYKKHPYKWPTIGKSISHIKNAKLSDVEDFFYTYYRPNNAILVVGSPIDDKEVLKLVNKWFSSIPSGKNNNYSNIIEPKQIKERRLTVYKPVPINAIYKVYRMVDRLHTDYYAYDLLSDILGNGKSSRLYQSLVKENPLFSSISAHISGSIDNGLFTIAGHLNENISIEDAENGINKVIDDILLYGIKDYELTKVKNKIETNIIYSESSILEKATNLAYFELLGDAAMINSEIENYNKVSTFDLIRISKEMFLSKNISTLHYLSNK